MYVPDGFVIRQALRKYFEGLIYARGQSYYATGRVQECAAAPAPRDRWLIQAKVIGSEIEPYRVQVTLSPKGPALHIESMCTCPFGGNCKHAVAALLYAANHHLRLFGPPTRDTELVQELWDIPFTGQQALKLDHRWEWWLSKL
ncbi:MAG TPA: SWIM zinc finger family protein, partial [Candidatus Saccharimonadales bacterium]|nr:SWIM zinc finger family protein [Candidatus Saccharimonadales bacterium]